MNLSEAIEAAKAGTGAMVRCPAHDDRQASLHISPGDEEPVVLLCQAGCTTRDVMAAAGLEWADIRPPLEPTTAKVSEWTPRGLASNVYSYTDEQGRELFQTLRIPVAGGGKTFMQRHREGPANTVLVGDSVKTSPPRWKWNLQDVRRVPYRLPKVLRAVANGQEVLVVEGEKDVETAERAGLVATCNPMGASASDISSKWLPEYSELLRGAKVTVVADCDEPGRIHARHVATSLAGHECEVRTAETTLPGCKDLTDHVAHGGTYADLRTTWTNVEPERVSYGVGIQDFCKLRFPPDIEVIPGILAQANVALVTGFEGHGKTELLHQMAACTAGGIHVFTGAEIEPRKVLVIDAENPEHQAQFGWVNLVQVMARLGHAVDNDMLTILSEWQSEPDLLTVEGRAWLHERVEAYRPHLVVMGPVQNLCGRDVKDDEVVRRFKRSVNIARTICGSAFVVEHHAPHRMAGDPERATRPYGSSLFQKWPDFGYGLRPLKDAEGVYDLHPNRKPRVRARAWPEQLRWGKPGTHELPWMPVAPTDGGTVSRMGARGA